MRLVFYKENRPLHLSEIQPYMIPAIKRQLILDYKLYCEGMFNSLYRMKCYLTKAISQL